MVKSAIQILGFNIPVYISKVTRGLADSILKAHFLCVCKQGRALFSSQQMQPWLTSLEDYERKWAMQCSARLLGFASGCAVAMWVTPHLFWPRLAACALAQISGLFTYTPSKHPWKADAASFEVLKNFAIHLQDQAVFFRRATLKFLLELFAPASSLRSQLLPSFSLKCCLSRVPANSTGVLEPSRVRRDNVFSSVGLVLCWVFHSSSNANFI